MATPGALATIDHNAILKRLSAGEIMRTIAAELGVAKQSLREQLIKHPGYTAAIQEQAESIVEQAVAEMMDPALPADTPVIARARARVDTAFKYAAARDPATFGNRPDAVQAAITINIVRAGGEQVEVSVNAAPAQLSEPKK